MPPSSPSRLLPPSSSSSIADAPLTVLPDEEKEEEEGADDVASLIPNLFSRLQHCDDTVTELEFQDIHRLLTLETSEDKVLRTATSFANQPLSMSKTNGESKNVEAQGPEVQKKSLSAYAQGKENAVPTKISERYRSMRRERSSRVTSHRRPFVVDLRSFGVANNDMLDDYKKLKDVHAFWEAADEREASEALMRKLRGENEPCTQQSVCEVPRSRRPGVRRKNSQRTTTRLKGFNVELPLCTEQVRLLDEERLEEEEEVTEESCFTFVQNPRTDSELEVSESQNGDMHIQNPQQNSSDIPSDLTMEAAYLAGKNVKPRNLVENDMLVEPCSVESSEPLTQTSNHRHTIDRANKEHNTELSQGCDSVQAITQQLGEAVRSPVAGIQGCSGVEVNLEDPLKVTPYIRNVLRKRTPATSPTPPSNPLAAHGLRKDNIFQQDMGKRRLEFNDTMPSPNLSPTMEPTHTDGTRMDSPCLQNVSASDISEATLMTSPQKELPCLHNVSPALEVPENQEQDTELQEADNLVDSNAHAPSIKETNEQMAQRTSKKFTAKRKRALTDRRDSLEGAGSKWDGGLRRSTRIKSRPLEWWRGERFLRGRVHKSLATVIGIKYSSPPPCWPKRGARLPQFKVESFVSDDYAKYVRFAALY